ncbi:hypothetical protein [Adhaeretor mobilis]|uniref:Uncharacterized protein n=1 Tax=Adhaeretor mobilis TaxID=1930276 RepID=A0A517MSB4_9BACT|nr:hypothetical protein [Adhaeretor mobilis]QDS97677.1 hypothetical protein HG15A2_09410 [Adhaeretor mobilis]
MSKHETPMTHWYWEQIGGTLIEEFKAVAKSATASPRWIDGVIVRDGAKRIVKSEEVDIKDQDIIVVQTKPGRSSMSLLGQAYFSAHLMQAFNPRSIISVALCHERDSVLTPIFESHPNMKVVVCPQAV